MCVYVNIIQTKSNTYTDCQFLFCKHKSYKILWGLCIKQENANVRKNKPESRRIVCLEAGPNICFSSKLVFLFFAAAHSYEQIQACRLCF